MCLFIGIDYLDSIFGHSATEISAETYIEIWSAILEDKPALCLGRYNDSAMLIFEQRINTYKNGHSDLDPGYYLKKKTIPYLKHIFSNNFGFDCNDIL